MPPFPARSRSSPPLHRPRLAALLLVPLFCAASALGAGCFGGGTSSAPAARGPLAPGEASGGASISKGPLAVVFGAPRGPATDAGQITIVMNRPMRALDLAGHEAPPFATLTPAVPGRWQWVGTSGLIFVPEKRLPRATAYRVEVPAGTKAQDGAALAIPYRFELTTARPAVLRVLPSAPPERLDAGATFTIHFNQPIADAEAARAIQIMAGRKRVELDVRRPDPKDESRIEVVPRARLPLDSSIELLVDASLRGVEGPLLSGEPSSFKFKTYGPLKVTKVSCGYADELCTPGNGSITIELTNYVKAADAIKAIQIDPPIPFHVDAYGEPGDTGELWLRVKLEPSAKYRVRVRAGVLDSYGQALATDFERSIGVSPFAPDARIAVEGSVFETSARRDIPIVTVNMKEVELAAAPLTQQAILDLLAAPDEEENRSSDGPPFGAITRLTGATRVTLKPSAALNVPWSHLLRTNDFLSDKTHLGAFAAAIRFAQKPGEKPDTRASIVQVTDLAISAKVSRFGSIVRVTRLSNAEPVAGASVTVRRPRSPSPAGAATPAPDVFLTDTAGFAVIPVKSFQPSSSSYSETAVIFAASGDDSTFRRVRDTLSIEGHWAMLDKPAMLGLVFTERPIYRPGEVVRVKGVFRDEGPLGVGLATPAGTEITLTAKGPGGVMGTSSKRLSRFGTVYAEMKIPEDAKLGYYRVQADAEEQDVSSSSSFVVAEYRPNEARVIIKSDRPSYIRGDKARFTVRGEYLFGTPVSGAGTRVHVSRQSARFSPPGVDSAFATDDEAYSSGLPRDYRSRDLLSSQSRLDAKGTAEIPVQLDMPQQRGAETIICDVEVTDASRQVVAERHEAIVHPAEFYIAMKPPADRLVPARGELRPEILAVDPKGAPALNVAVRVDLIERTWQSAQTSGRTRREATPSDRVAASCNLSSKEKPVSCAITPPSAGYYILRAVATDRRGNTAASASPVYALGDGEPGWAQGKGISIDIVPDKEMYEVGQTARLLVKSPFPAATAIVTVERAGIMSRRTVALAGRAPVVDVPITDEMWPNAYVSVALFRGTSVTALAKPTKASAPPDAEPAGAAAFRIGYAELSLNPDLHRLKVTLKPSKVEARPGAPIDIDIEVQGRAGAPARAEVTLYAVDEGVLSLAPSKRPDPLAVFAEPRMLGVASIESREALARVLDPSAALFGEGQVRMGATSVSREVRQDFQTVAYYNPSLLTDERGHARATFKLPDGLTSYRLTAVAVTEDDMAGTAEGRITASLPLMVRPALPRFFRAGDAIDAGVIVTSKLSGKARVEVQAEVSGLTLAGDAKRVIEIGETESKEVRFSFAAPAVGPASLRFTAKADSASDAVSVKREIRAPGAVEAIALYGETDASTEERLGDISAIRGDVGGLELRLSSSALVGLDAGIEQLIDYPYGCTEQLTSRLIPLLPLRELAKTYSIALPPNIADVIASSIAKIAANQHRSGGFGLWADSPETSTWVTAYALFGLSEARRYGARVPGSVIERATSYLIDTLNGTAWDEDDRAVIPFILDVLAEAGAGAGAAGKGSAPVPLKAKVIEAYAGRSKLPLFAQAILAHAMVKVGADRDKIDRIVVELEGNLRLDGPTARAIITGGPRYPDLLDSDTRTSALVLRALLAARSSHPLARPLAIGILADRRGGAWRTTQEAAWALLALDQYRRAEEPTEPNFLARVSLGKTTALEAPFRGRSVVEAKGTVPASALAASAGSALTFTADGEGSLFYEARLRYVPRTPPRQPLDRGFFIKRTLRPVDPEGLSEALAVTPETSKSTFRGGDLVLADILVVTPSPRQYVVIDDPLPAGLEPVDTGLASTAQWLREALSDDGRPVASGDAGFSRAWAREELRDDRALFFIDRMPAGMYRFRYLARATTPGSFLAPPSRAEEMYTPEVFGRSGADVVTVTAR